MTSTAVLDNPPMHEQANYSICENFIGPGILNRQHLRKDEPYRTFRLV